jgi:hypothetical protein
MFSIPERLGLQSEAIKGHAWQWACMLRCAIPGIVVDFDPVLQTCSVQVAVQERILVPQPPDTTQPDPVIGFNIPQDVPIDVLQQVPIVVPHVNGWSMTLPITPGTECLLVFADMCIDGWWDTGKVLPQYDRRRHDLSDAFAIFGPWSQPFAKNITDYSTTSVQLRSDDLTVLIDLAPGAVTIQAPIVNIAGMGGTPKPLINSDLITWITGTLIPALAGHGIMVAPPPATVVTTVVKGE